jgi:hypothetical protein
MAAPLARQSVLSTLSGRSVFSKTGQSAKSKFCELECSEAAIGDLNLPAICGR